MLYIGIVCYKSSTDSVYTSVLHLKSVKPITEQMFELGDSLSV